MDHADLGGGGPFAYYPVTGDAIRDAASETDTQTGLVDTIRRQVEGEHRRMMAAVEGDLEGPMQEAPALAIGNMVRVAQASQFAAGVLRLFADAVDQFNHTSSAPRSVDALNAAYAEARIADFGLDRISGAAWEDANAALLGRLRSEYGRLEAQLDMWADHAARMLYRGPTADDVLELWALGALAPDAADTWPGLDLNHVPVWRLPYELRDEVGDRSLESLSDDQLMALWEDHGYRPARELLGPRIAYDIQTRADLDEFNLKINPSYWKAISEGMPEKVARLYADANPGNFLMIYAPFVIGGQIAYDVFARDFVDAFKDDPLSWRTAGEIAMATPFGKIAKVDNVIDVVDDLRDARRLEDTPEWQDISGIVREAEQGKGNFGLASGSRAESDAAGLAWVGDDFRLSSNGKALISGDGLRQYRLPTYKPRRGIWQANFEERLELSGEWQSNGHLDIVDP
jgi:hypothetical protein